MLGLCDCPRLSSPPLTPGSPLPAQTAPPTHECVNAFAGCYGVELTGQAPYRNGSRALNDAQMAAYAKPLAKVLDDVVERSAFGAVYSNEVVQGPFWDWFNNPDAGYTHRTLTLCAYAAATPSVSDAITALSFIIVKDKDYATNKHAGVFQVMRHPSRFAQNMKPLTSECIQQVSPNRLFTLGLTSQLTQRLPTVQDWGHDVIALMTDAELPAPRRLQRNAQKLDSYNEGESATEGYYVLVSKYGAQELLSGVPLDPAKVQAWSPGFFAWVTGYVLRHRKLELKFPSGLTKEVQNSIFTKARLILSKRLSDTSKPSGPVPDNSLVVQR